MLVTTDAEKKDIVLTLLAASETTRVKYESLEDAYLGFIKSGETEADFLAWLGTLLVDLDVTEAEFHRVREKLAKEAS